LRFNIDVQGVSAAEPLNYSCVAHETGFARELVEAGIKDIAFSLSTNLKKGLSVNLGMHFIGKLVFENQTISFR
jgi:hypothetical protein